MASSNKKSYCDILRYIKEKDREFYNVISDRCLKGVFIPKRKSNGITFLYPDDKFIKKIIKLNESDPVKANETIRSLVIIDYLPTADMFDKFKEDIPNALRKRVKILGVEKSGADKVIKFSDTVTAIKDPGFEQTPRDGVVNLAVYKLRGDAGVQYGDETKFTFSKRIKSEAVKGGDENPMDSGRRKIAEITEADSWAALKSGRDLKVCFTTPVVSFCLWVKDQHNDLYPHVVRRMCWNPVTAFHRIFEAYCINPQLIPNNIIDGWFEIYKNEPPKSKQQLLSDYKEIMNSASTVIPNYDEIFKKRLALQSSIIHDVGKPINPDVVIDSWYDSLAELFWDERILLDWRLFKDMQEDPASARDIFKSYLYRNKFLSTDIPTSKDQKNKLWCLNKQMQVGNDNVGWYTVTYAFIKSTAAFYIPYTESVVSSDALGVLPSDAVLKTPDLINISLDNYNELVRALS